MSVPALIFPLLTTTCAALLLLALRWYTMPGLGALLAQQAQGTLSPPGWVERVLLPLVRRLTPSPRWVWAFVDHRWLRRTLAAAGDPYGLTLHDLVRLKLASVLLCLPIACYFGLTLRLGVTTTLVMAAALALPCFFVPDLWIDGRAVRRQEEIGLQLPDVMDLLAIAIGAGVGFDLALQIIVGRMRGPLAEELERMLRELRLGTPRRQAYRKVMWRNTLPALRGLFGALVQADELGTPIADILEWQAQTLRQRRLQEARRRGARASTKISLVLSTVLLVSVIGVLMATLGLNLYYGRINLIAGS